ncbi:MAG: nicotinate (nicotinamide) nucleotide adenylyltransferase [Endomicrobiales bacterium]|nr:nicotinate (nicotinamide) nucleotide adenylyltransferase [Endomicrobiales bacterium]
MKNVKNIGLFGGSFDPVHRGHTALALAAMKEYGLDRVVFIPAKIPPHRNRKKLTAPANRLKMLTLALRPFRRFSIDRYELNRKGTTYTYQTVSHFRSKYPKCDIFFIIGSDSLIELGTWKRIDRILDSCTFITGRRKGVKVPDRCRYAGRVKFIKKAMPAVSSTGIRQSIRKGRSPAAAVAAPVGRYIAAKGLYK